MFHRKLRVVLLTPDVWQQETEGDGEWKEMTGNTSVKPYLITEPLRLYMCFDIGPVYRCH